MQFRSRGLLFCAAAALSIGAGVVRVSAAPIIAAKTDSLDHNQTESAFFTSNVNNSVTFGSADNWAPTGPAQAGTISSVTTRKTYNIAGNSTAAGNWLDGNAIPAGITLSFQAEVTISAIPAGNFLTNANTTGTGLGNGITISPTSGVVDANIAVNEGISVSAVTVSNVNFTGTLTDPNFTFAPGGVSDYGTRALRSNNFTEATAGMVLTQGANTIGFGTATGTVASNVIVDNNLSNPFARQVGPYTLVVTQGTSIIKGIGLGYDVTYDISAAVPEPTAAALLGAIGAAAALARTRRRRPV